MPASGLSMIRPLSSTMFSPFFVTALSIAIRSNPLRKTSVSLHETSLVQKLLKVFVVFLDNFLLLSSGLAADARGKSFIHS